LADVRISQLPLATGATSPQSGDFVAIDGVTTRKTNLSSLANVIRPVASQAEAESGTNSVKTMTPLTTKQSIQFNSASPSQGAKADSALQPEDVGSAAYSSSSSFATSSQGLLASSALQPSDINGIVSQASSAIVPIIPVVQSSKAIASSNFHPNASPAFVDTAGFSFAGDGNGERYTRVNINGAYKQYGQRFPFDLSQFNAASGISLGANQNVSAGKLVVSNPSSASSSVITAYYKAGRTYLIGFYVDTIASGNITIQLRAGSTIVSSSAAISTPTQAFAVLTPSQDCDGFYIRAAAGTVATLEYISDVEISGVDSLALTLSDSSTAYYSDYYSQDVVFEIGSSGDFPSWADAIDFLSRAPLLPGKTFELRMKAGATITKGILLQNGDWSRFRLTSTDATVTVDPSFVGVANTFADDTSASFIVNNNLFCGDNARMPTLSCLIDFASARGSGRKGHGVYLRQSEMRISSGCGVINSGLCGIGSQRSTIYGVGSVWSGSGSEALRMTQASDASFQAAIANNCQVDPVSAASNAVVFCSRGTCLHVTDGQFRNAGKSTGGTVQNSNAWGIDCHRAWLSATNADFSGAAGRGANCQLGGRLILTTANVSGSGEIGLRVTEGGMVEASEANFSGASTSSVRVDSRGCIVNLNGARTNSSTGSGPTYNPSISDVANINQFNWASSNGIVFGPSGFSTSGATDGKEIGTNAILDSSRNGLGTGTHYRFYNSNGQIGSISTNASSTTFGTTSDETFKVFHGNYDALEAIKIIKSDPVRKFNWTPEKGGSEAVGWGAQTSYSISKDLASPGRWYDPVTGEDWEKGGSRKDDNGEKIVAAYEPWSVDQSKRTPYLWAATSYLIDKVLELEEKLKAMGK
jgi:hypothetical protein